MSIALIIGVDGHQARRQVKSLEDMQAIVGGFIELVPLESCDLWLNEDGIGLDLPCNPVATRFVKRELAKEGRIVLTDDGWILGPVFLTGKVNSDGNPTDCPEIAVK